MVRLPDSRLTHVTPHAQASSHGSLTATAVPRLKSPRHQGTTLSCCLLPTRTLSSLDTCPPLNGGFRNLTPRQPSPAHMLVRPRRGLAETPTLTRHHRPLHRLIHCPLGPSAAHVTNVFLVGQPSPFDGQCPRILQIPRSSRNAARNSGRGGATAARDRHLVLGSGSNSPTTSCTKY